MVNGKSVCYSDDGIDRGCDCIEPVKILFPILCWKATQKVALYTKEISEDK